MFRLRALRRACWKHSFVFNPLAARPVQHGGDKARVYLSFEQELGFFLPIVLCRQLADPGKGRWEAGVPFPALMLLVVSAWVNPFTLHQYKHKCWCYQRLLLVYLSVLRQWLGTPKHEHTQSRGQYQSQVQFSHQYNITCHDSNLPHPSHTGCLKCSKEI